MMTLTYRVTQTLSAAGIIPKTVKLRVKDKRTCLMLFNPHINRKDYDGLNPLIQL